MTEQIDALRNLISAAKAGSRAADLRLRAILTKCADKAPLNDLIVIAECLYKIRMDAAQTEIQNN